MSNIKLGGFNLILVIAIAFVTHFIACSLIDLHFERKSDEQEL
jgi:hypothetical protein